MMTVIEDPDHVGSFLNASELKIPFSDTVKYCILAVSVILLLVALCILAWQIFRCFSHSYFTYTQDSMNSDLLYLEEKPSTEKNYSAPGMKVENQTTQSHRLSRCLSQTWFSSSETSMSDVNFEEQKTNKKVLGSLRFSVFFDRLESRLVICVLQAEGLSDSGEATSMQPFVKVRLMKAGLEGTAKRSLKKERGEESPSTLWAVLQEWDTRIVKGSDKALFGDEFSFILQETKNILHHLKLRMEVRDFDKFSRQTLLGEVNLPLKHLDISFPLVLQEDLQAPQKDLVGEVLLSLKFLPTSQRLEVGLLKIRTAFPNICSDAALYAKISVQCNQSKLKPQKTSAVVRSAVTVFNEVLIFLLPDFAVDQCKILVSVYETCTDAKSSRSLIGHLCVGKDRNLEDEHWTLMLRSIRQPVAKWHALLI
ncbi:synaptotagmin-2-like [Oryzias latipes]|uniref:C2 domain-containing protein n=1 Tax=Oryzias latipes TaxID=8090 RepID=A0A3B3IFE2_ORYLA|nr:synaptotagmin-2-like [Oryzias latipes]